MIFHKDVLDHGYVRLTTWKPWNMAALYQAVKDGDLEKAQSLLDKDDLGAVNAAKASFEKEAASLSPRQIRLIDFLAEHGHSSPFRHPVLELEIRAPLVVARQWHTYIVGSVQDPLHAWNESSRRYVTEEPEFYVPSQWRKAAQNRKQGSDGVLELEDQGWLDGELAEVYQGCLNGYNTALEMGATPEQARLFLPAYGLYVRWRWTASLQGVCHFLQQRQAEDSQWETRQYADAVRELVEQVFPESVRALLEE